MAKRKKTGRLKNKSFQGLKDQSLFASSVVFESHPKLFQALEGRSPSRYDKIMDQTYRDTHIGGGAHRHFDGSHTFKGSYDTIKSSIRGLVDPVEYLKAHFKELVTPEGIPLFTLDQTHHAKISSEISEALGGAVSPEQIRQYIRSMNSFNAGDLAVAGLGSVFLFLALRSGSSKAISRTAAVNICLGAAAGNPLQLLVGAAGLAAGLHCGKIKSYDLLRGSAPVISGMIAHKAARGVFDFSKNGAIVFSIGAVIASEAVLSHLERKRKEKILNELGRDNPHYIAALTPEILGREFMRLSRKTPAIGAGLMI